MTYIVVLLLFGMSLAIFAGLSVAEEVYYRLTGQERH